MCSHSPLRVCGPLSDGFVGDRVGGAREHFPERKQVRERQVPCGLARAWDPKPKINAQNKGTHRAEIDLVVARFWGGGGGKCWVISEGIKYKLAATT